MVGKAGTVNGLSRRSMRLRWALPLIVLIAGIAATEWRVQADDAQRHDEAVVLATNEAVHFGERLATGLEATYFAGRVLNAYVLAHDGILTPREMDAFLAGLTGLLPYVRSIAIAPDNRIEYIAPLAGNEAALGLNYPDNAEQWPAIQAIIASGEASLVGPINLVQGGRGLAFRLPVTIPGKGYWGMVSTVIDSDAFLKAAAEAGIQRGSAGVRAIDANGDAGPPFWGSAQAFDDAATVVNVRLLGATWQAGVAARPVSSPSTRSIRIVGYSLTILVALLVLALIIAIQRRRQLSKRLSRLSERVPGMLYEMRVTPDGRSSFPYVSQGIEQMFGVTPDEVKVDAYPLLSRVVEADAERLRTALDEAASADEPWHQQLRMRNREGAERWYLTEAVPDPDTDGGTLWHGFITDVTSEMAAQDRLRVSASVYESTHDGVVIMDQDTLIAEVNPGFTALTGYTIDDVRGRTLEALGSDLTPDAVYQEMHTSLDRHDFWRGEVVSRLHDGRVATQAVAVTAVRGDAGALSHFVAIVSSQNSLQDDLATGLPNRQVLGDRLTQAVERARLTDERVALIAVSIDEFRDINETLGHRTGDLVLKEAAARLRAVVPETETVARLGGDEFAVLLCDTTDSATIERIAAQVVSTLAQPFILGTREVHCTGSAGVSVFPDDAPDAANLLITTNQAMRVAKEHGRNRHRYFTAAMQVDALERAQLTDDLRRAIPDGDLHLVFQPIIDIPTGRIVKGEALVRWEHPERGPIGPDYFIPIAEKSGLIKDIGDWVFNEVLSMTVKARVHVPDFEIGFNMSPVEVADDNGLHDRRLQLMLDQDVPGSALVVEITEGLLLDRSETVTTNLEAYRTAGIQLAIDDFGTGYSSLSYLQGLDVDYLKIDQSFVNGIATNSENLALCEAIIEMAHKLGLHVIAEGIETQAQRDLLAAASCDFGQGYLLSRPLAADAFLAILSENARTSPAESPDSPH